jgi:hypothetical protein
MTNTDGIEEKKEAICKLRKRWRKKEKITKIKQKRRKLRKSEKKKKDRETGEGKTQRYF